MPGPEKDRPELVYDGDAGVMTLVAGFSDKWVGFGNMWAWSNLTFYKHFLTETESYFPS